jgi:hypothetical protein
MSLVSDMLAKIKELGRKAADFVKGPSGKLSALIPLIPAGKKKILFIGLGSALIICLIALVSGMNYASDARVKETGSLIRAIQQRIPPEDLFLSDEPDFLPGPIPGREQRDSWTAEDAEPFWYNPLEKGEEQWRNRIEAVVDELLEHVP